MPDTISTGLTTATLDLIDSPELWGEADPAIRVRASFPLNGSLGTERTAVVYFELAPGCALGTHTDSAEEVLLVLAGAVEVTVGEATEQAGEGTLVLVPEMVPHNVRNVGDGPARVVGFFPSDHVTATFDEAFLPPGQRVFAF